jgi:hypothetical protein
MEDALLVLLGTAGTLIVGLLGVIVAMQRRNGNHNPSLATLDEKLNQILLVLTEMKAVMERCPVPRQRR